MECLSYCLAEKIDLQLLEKNARALEIYKVSRQSQVIILDPIGLRGVCFIFSNGTMVTWGMKRYQLRPFLNLVAQSSNQLLAKPLFDGVSYVKSDVTKLAPHDYFNVELLMLEEIDLETTLSLSYGFSQSVKLKYFEEKLETLIQRYLPMTQKLSKKGKMFASRKKVQKIISEILSAKAELNLTSDFLYAPKFFWQHPNLEENFLKLRKYMDVQVRAETVNEKLNTLNEIFLMFNSYLETQHSYRLEVVIIILIAIEIIFNVLNLHL